jgi:hypothetical protein
MAAGYVREVVGTVTLTFDFENELINIDAGTDVLLVTDLWTAIKRAQWTPRALVFDPIATGGGLDDLGEVDGDEIESYLTVTMLGNWELRSLKTGGKFTVTGGNLIKENGLDPFVDNPLITHFLFLSQAGTVARVSVGSAVTPSDITAIGAEVEGRILSDGTAFPGANIDAAVSTPTGLTEAQAAILSAISTLTTELHRFTGLDADNPATLTQMGGGVQRIAAGAITQTITSTGDPETTGSTVEFERTA